LADTDADAIGAVTVGTLAEPWTLIVCSSVTPPLVIATRYGPVVAGAV